MERLLHALYDVVAAAAAEQEHEEEEVARPSSNWVRSFPLDGLSIDSAPFPTDRCWSPNPSVCHPASSRLLLMADIRLSQWSMHAGVLLGRVHRWPPG